MMSGNVGLGPPGPGASIRAMFPSEPREPTRSDATEDASRLGEPKNARRVAGQARCWVSFKLLRLRSPDDAQRKRLMLA